MRISEKVPNHVEVKIDGVDRELLIKWGSQIRNNEEKLRFVTAPGFDRALKDSLRFNGSTVSVSQRCGLCVLSRKCHAALNTDKLANLVTTSGECLKK